MLRLCCNTLAVVLFSVRVRQSSANLSSKSNRKSTSFEIFSNKGFQYFGPADKEFQTIYLFHGKLVYKGDRA